MYVRLPPPCCWWCRQQWACLRCSSATFSDTSWLASLPSASRPQVSLQGVLGRCPRSPRQHTSQQVQNSHPFLLRLNLRHLPIMSLLIEPWTLHSPMSSTTPYHYHRRMTQVFTFSLLGAPFLSFCFCPRILWQEAPRRPGGICDHPHQRSRWPSDWTAPHLWVLYPELLHLFGMGDICTPFPRTAPSTSIAVAALAGMTHGFLCNITGRDSLLEYSMQIAQLGINAGELGIINISQRANPDRGRPCGHQRILF